MAVFIKGKEIQLFMTDVDGTLYGQDIVEKVFTLTRRNLAISLLAGQGNLKPILKEIETMTARYLHLAENQGSFKIAFIQMGGNPDTFDDLLINTDRSRFLKPNPELGSMLKTISKHAYTAIITGANEVTNNATCQKLLGSNWRALFDHVACIDTPGVHHFKPEVQAFLSILNMFDVAPQNTVVIGDSPKADLKTPQDLGMLTVQVGRNDFQGADIYVPEITALQKYLRFVDIP